MNAKSNFNIANQQLSKIRIFNLYTKHLKILRLNCFRTITKDRKSSRESKKTEIPPEFIIKPRRQFVNEDQSAKFKASHDGSSSTVLTWRKDGTVLHSSRKNKVLIYI